MATSFSHEQDYAGDPAALAAVLRDPDFIADKCARTGSLESHSTLTDGPDGGVVLTTVRVLPADVPSAARKLVGDTITVTEVQSWGPPGPDGSAHAEVTVEFSAPMGFRGTMGLAPGGTGTLVRTEGSFKASVPLIGGSLERMVADQTRRYLEVEQSVGNEWLQR